MLETNTMKNNISNYFFNLIIILIIFLNNSNFAYGANSNWIEASRTQTGIQYWDRDSIISKGKEVIEITTKYIRIDSQKSNKIDENIYVMRINCLTNKYKDISVNGKNNSSAKWQGPNGDKLINDVISDSCKNV